MKKINKVSGLLLCASLICTNPVIYAQEQDDISYTTIDISSVANAPIYAKEGDTWSGNYVATAPDKGRGIDYDSMKELLTDGVFEHNNTPYKLDVEINKNTAISTGGLRFDHNDNGEVRGITQNYNYTGVDVDIADGRYSGLKILASATGNRPHGLLKNNGFADADITNWNNTSKLAVVLQYTDGTSDIVETMTAYPVDTTATKTLTENKDVFPADVTKTDTAGNSITVKAAALPDGTALSKDNFWNGFKVKTITNFDGWSFGGKSTYSAKNGAAVDIYINEYTFPVDSEKILKNIHIVGSCADYTGVKVKQDGTVDYSNAHAASNINWSDGMYGSMVYAMTAVTDKSVIKESAKKSVQNLIDANPGINIAEDAALLAELNNIIDSYSAYGISAEDILSEYKPQISDLRITGTYGAGNTLTLAYNFSDPLGGADASEFKWYKASSIAAVFPDEYTQISGADQNAYTMQAEDDGFIIRAEIVPKTPSSAISGRILENSPSVTQTFFKEAAPTATNVKLACDTEAKKIAAGSKLAVSYDYFDPNMIADENIDVESGTQIEIQKSADKTNWGTLADLSNLQAFEYVLTESDINVYLRAKIVPKNNHAPEPETGDAVYSDVIAAPFAPSASNVAISGSGQAGTTLTCTYKFEDINGNADIDSEIVWYKGSTEIGRGVNYTVTNGDVGSSVNCVVTPKTDAAPTTGTPASSNSVMCTSGNSSGGSGSSGGGGGFRINPDLSTKNAQDIVPPISEPDYNYTYAFGDIQNHWARDSVERMYKKGIVSGKGDGFYPDDGLIRAELAVIVSNAIGAKASYSNCFEDVIESDWFAPYAQGLFDKKIIVGSDGKFAPHDAVTREMAIQIIVAAYKDKLAEDSDYQIDAPDSAEISSWAENAVKTAVKNGIIKGREDGSIAPKAVLTRAEAVSIIDRLMENVQ